jgi:site-specific DNA recombinase
MRATRVKKASSTRQTISYIRVLTEEQATSGVSLDAQKARIVAYAIAMGFDVSDVVQDAGVSAKTQR